MSDNPLRASIHGLLSKEFEESKAERVTVAEGSPESQSRLCDSFGYKCIKGLKYDLPNQDDFFVIQDNSFCVYGVFDGHGPEGHIVADFVQRMLPEFLMSEPNLQSSPKAALTLAFKKVQMAICASHTRGQINAEESGTTATIVLQLNDKLFVAYVGDSKAVLLTQADHRLEVAFATRDHKPDRPDETRRINRYGGEVRLSSEDSLARFFQRGSWKPGLLISRCLGDVKYQAFGLSYEPEIVELPLTSACRFMVVATDGLWDHLKPAYVASVLSKVNDIQIATEQLVLKSWDSWMATEEASADDITALVSRLS